MINVIIVVMARNHRLNWILEGDCNGTKIVKRYKCAVEFVLSHLCINSQSLLYPGLHMYYVAKVPRNPIRKGTFIAS